MQPWTEPVVRLISLGTSEMRSRGSSGIVTGLTDFFSVKAEWLCFGCGPRPRSYGPDAVSIAVANPAAVGDEVQHHPPASLLQRPGAPQRRYLDDPGLVYQIRHATFIRQVVEKRPFWPKSLVSLLLHVRTGSAAGR
ncbi:hypothetical protein XA68_14564 [Ophiocordyceps unilateralis]|uniref:Uncharacterized protein n=1 Tax=Ophiocordyceps unilateralis TaxID=268505 RepID=A0A2A9PAB9_OPHUN|nr:hypothetical protein XA68_14564 [Ophiocordyceps unilateralis]